MLDLGNREAAKYEESSYLRILLDSRDAWLGPWIPGRYLPLLKLHTRYYEGVFGLWDLAGIGIQF